MFLRKFSDIELNMCELRKITWFGIVLMFLGSFVFSDIEISRGDFGLHCFHQRGLGVYRSAPQMTQGGYPSSCWQNSVLKLTLLSISQLKFYLQKPKVTLIKKDIG
jgi:hypothetical protein